MSYKVKKEFSQANDQTFLKIINLYFKSSIYGMF
jgi:hypothetical protein